MIQHISIWWWVDRFIAQYQRFSPVQVVVEPKTQTCPSHRCWWNSDETTVSFRHTGWFQVLDSRMEMSDVPSTSCLLPTCVFKHETPATFAGSMWASCGIESIVNPSANIVIECKLRHPHLMVVKPSNCGWMHVLQAHHEGSVPSKSINYNSNCGSCVNATIHIITMRCSLIMCDRLFFYAT